MSLVQRFNVNSVGRDFVVGDIHGMFGMLEEMMDDVKFDPKVDRLFSVGDLVDRGERSIEAVDWIKQPWFHAVRGNHEQMAIGVAAGRHDLANYLQNGGEWFLVLSDEEQKRIASAFESLPICISVDVDDMIVGIVHADVGDSWTSFIEQLENVRSNNHRKDLLETALWDRDRIRDFQRNPNNAPNVEGIDVMYVGHTPVKSPINLGNVVYVDTGAVFGKKLTMLQIN